MFKFLRQRNPTIYEKIPTLFPGRHIVIDGMVCTITRAEWPKDGTSAESSRVLIHASALAPIKEFMEEGDRDNLPPAP